MIKGVATELLIDSGADVNTLGEKDWVNILGQHVENKIQLEDLKWGNGKKTLSAYASRNTLVIEATFTAEIEIRETGKTTRTKFFVIRGAKKNRCSVETQQLH